MELSVKEPKLGGANGPTAADLIAEDKRTAMEKLTKIKNLLMHTLEERIETGTATHQELAIAAKVLKDNGLTLVPPKSEEEEQEAADRPPADLPDFPEDDTP